MHPSSRTVRDVVAVLAGERRAQPALTWYGPPAERVELSGRVLANWVVKATNLLVAEADAGPGVRVAVDIPVHWRALAWTLGVWTAGAHALLGGATGDRGADAVVTTRPEDAAWGSPHGPGLVVAVALPPLTLRFPGALPAGALDGAADLMAYPDTLGWVPALDAASPGLDADLTHGDLLEWAADAASAHEWPETPRVLHVGVDLRRAVAVALAAWARSGSLVLVGDPSDLGDPGRDVAVVARAERVTTTA